MPASQPVRPVPPLNHALSKGTFSSCVLSSALLQSQSLLANHAGILTPLLPEPTGRPEPRSKPIPAPSRRAAGTHLYLEAKNKRLHEVGCFRQSTEVLRLRTRLQDKTLRLRVGPGAGQSRRGQSDRKEATFGQCSCVACRRKAQGINSAFSNADPQQAEGVSSSSPRTAGRERGRNSQERQEWRTSIFEIDLLVSVP